MIELAPRLESYLLCALCCIGIVVIGQIWGLFEFVGVLSFGLVLLRGGI